MKKLICIFCAAALLLSFAACGKKEEAPTVAVEDLTAAKSQYIDAQVAENLDMVEVIKTDAHTYYRTVMEGKQVFCRTDLQGRMKVLLTFKNNPTFYPETFERSGKIFLYFSYKFEGAATAILYALNLSNERIMTVAPSPCSDFIMLDLPNSFEMYPYGFIADTGGVKVIDLRSGGVNAQYSITIPQMKSFFVEPDSFPDQFFGDGFTASISDMGDREHIRIDVVEKDKKGGVKNKWAVKFTPKLSVALEIKE